MLEQEPFQQSFALVVAEGKLCISSAPLLLWWLLLINPIVLLLSVSHHTLGVTPGTEESMHGFPELNPCVVCGIWLKSLNHTFLSLDTPIKALQPSEDRILLFPSGFALVSKDLCEIFFIQVPPDAS